MKKQKQSQERKLIEKRKEQRETDPIRVPRPLGLTMALMEYHTSKNQDIITNIKQNQIEAWITTGMQLNGRVMNIQQLAIYLSLPVSYIMRVMSKAMNRVGNWLKDDKLQETTRAIFSHALFSALENQALSLQQVHILLAEQGQQYVPFLSSEVNKALANNTAAQKPLHSLLEILKPNTTIMPIANADGNSKNVSVTPDEAIILIRNNSTSPIEDTKTLDAIWTEEKGQLQLPDVDARNQDLSSIGIGKRKNKKLKRPLGPDDTVVPEPSRGRRREQDNLNIITDADHEDFVA